MGKQSCKELKSKAPSQESAGPGPSHRIIGLVGPQVSVPSFSSRKSHAHSKSPGEFFAQREWMLAPVLMQTQNEPQRGRNLLQQGQFLLLHSRSPQKNPSGSKPGLCPLEHTSQGREYLLHGAPCLCFHLQWCALASLPMGLPYFSFVCLRQEYGFFRSFPQICCAVWYPDILFENFRKSPGLWDA